MRKKILLKLLSCLLVIALAVLSVLLPFIHFEKKMISLNVPESYRPYLRELHIKYPEWEFVMYETGLDWNEVINAQCEIGKNLVEDYIHSVPDSWKAKKDGTFDAINNKYIPLSGDTYVQASDDIIKYFMDPRNFLNEENIFQFEHLKYSEHQSIDVVKTILKGSFMEEVEVETGITYADTFMIIGKKLDLSPYLLATRVVQEQSPEGGSLLISGKYEGYEGYYNYFNIKAAGGTQQEVVENGLLKAKEEGWDTIYKSLEGGAEYLAENYILQGQDTLYLQKFDVESEHSGLYWHQYMQALYAAFNEGNTVEEAYRKLEIKDGYFKFKIPVYENMPEFTCALPD